MGSKARPRLYRAVTVEWVDACSMTPWTDSVDFRHYKEGGPVIVTRGYIVRENQKSIMVAQNIMRKAEDGRRGFSDIMQIPRGCIRRVTVKRCAWVRL